MATTQFPELIQQALYHSQRWCRGFWIQSPGMKVVLPPPEERNHVKTAIGAAQQASERSR